MANTRLYTRSFAGGEVSPEMFGRIDDSHYQTGAKTMRNFVVKPQGAARSRPGFEYVANTKFADKPTRLIPFVFNNDQAYVLEFGEQYIRLHLDGSPVALTNIPAFVASNTVTFDGTTDVVTWTGQTLVTDDLVVFTGGTLPTGLVLGQVYYVANPVLGSFQVKENPTEPVVNFTGNGTGTTTGKRRYLQGDVVSQSGTNYYCIGQNDSVTPPSPTQWYALSGSILEIPTQYDDTDIMDIHYVQSGDVLTLSHSSYWPMEFRRYSATRWSFVAIQLGSSIQAPTTVSGIPAYGRLISIGSMDPKGASPEEFHCVENPRVNVGDVLYFYNGVNKSSNQWSNISIPSSFYYALKRGFYVVASVAGNNLTLSRIDGGPVSIEGSASAVYTAPSLLPYIRYAAFFQPASIAFDLTNNYRVTPVDSYGMESVNYASVSIDNNLYVTGSANGIVIGQSDGAVKYNVYKMYNGVYGYVGSSDAGAHEYVAASSILSSLNANEFYYVVTSNNHGLVENQAIWSTDVEDDLNGPPRDGENIFFVHVLDVDTFTIKISPSANATMFYGSTSTSGFISYKKLSYFIDDNVAPDMGLTQPIVDDVATLSSVGNYPSSVTYFEQRRMFAGTNNDPQTFWATRSNSESDMSYHIPIQSDDRIKIKVSARQASQIRHLVPLNNLLALTSQAEWRITSIDSDALTPSTVSVRPQSYVGANNVQPQIVNNSLLYCASRGGHVREIGYNWQQQSYSTGDVSIRSSHLFDNYELTDMALSKAPQPVVWFTSTSGKLLGLTYIPEEQVGAWHWHDTAGSFLSVCSIPEGEEDRLYAVIRRGASQFVERMDAFEFPDLNTYVGLDCSLSFDGTEPNNAHHVHVTGGTNWTPNETLTLTMSHNHFAYPATTDVGDQIVVYDASGEEYRLTILTTSSATVATAKPNKTIPTALRSVAIYGWAWARDSFSGLGHLNGFTVRALADGVALEPQVVSGGTILVNPPAVHLVVGLPYTCDLETLPVAMQMDGFGQGRTKNVNKAWVKVYQAAGTKVGPSADGLVPIAPYETVPELKTTEVQVLMTPAWMDTGTVLVRQDEPLPTTILGMTTEISIGG